MLLVLGVFLAVAGLLLVFAGKIPFLGKLPGDIHLRGKNWSFYFPITTCILLSLFLTLVFWLLRLLGGK